MTHEIIIFPSFLGNNVKVYFRTMNVNVYLIHHTFNELFHISKIFWPKKIKNSQSSTYIRTKKYKSLKHRFIWMWYFFFFETNLNVILNDERQTMESYSLLRIFFVSKYLSTSTFNAKSYFQSQFYTTYILFIFPRSISVHIFW